MNRFYQVLVCLISFAVTPSHIFSIPTAITENDLNELVAFMSFLEWDLTESKIYHNEKKRLFPIAHQSFCQLIRTDSGVALLLSHENPDSIVAKIEIFQRKINSKHSGPVCKDMQVNSLPKRPYLSQKATFSKSQHGGGLIEAIKKRDYPRALKILSTQINSQPKQKALYYSVQKVYAGSQKAAGQVALDPA